MAKLMFVLAVLTRFLPHPWNLSPVFGALLYGGARMQSRDSVWFPVAVLAASDVLFTLVLYRVSMNWTHLWVWMGYAVIALIGRMLRTKVDVRRFLSAGIASTAAFFIITNFGVWLGYDTYPRTTEGLVACYIAALPLYRNSVVASLIFGAFLFGAHWLCRVRLQRRVDRAVA